MQEKKKLDRVRVRFAPAPTGMMHLGNIRTALINYIFSKQKNGIFVLRIEDTDLQRNYDPEAVNIIANLLWLNLDYDEGPKKDSNKDVGFGPYFQSERTEIYKKALLELIEKNGVYRCFCLQQDLEIKRQRQIALKQPPRYDRTCLKLSLSSIEEKLKSNIPFIWRVKIDPDKSVSFMDLAKGMLTFDLKNFWDFPITRQDGSFTFTFANCVDDIKMEITHVFRGEDHLTNTVDQVVLFNIFDKNVPVFWHLPIICDREGKKLSKRNFGFSLSDLKDAGYLPEAICNYLAIIGGSFDPEIQSLSELIKNFNFENINSTGAIKYDLEKLNWVNHKWIISYSPEKLTELCLPFLRSIYNNIDSFNKDLLIKLMKFVQADLKTLQESVAAIRFYFEKPNLSHKDIQAKFNENIDNLLNIFKKCSTTNNSEVFISEIKKEAKNNNITTKTLFSCLRLILMGSINGPSVHDLIDILGMQEVKDRIIKI